MQEYNVRVYDNCVMWRNKKGEFHRLEGPAVEWTDGDKYWYFKGNLHRLDGPAIERPSGKKYWYIEGAEFTEEEFIKRTSTTITPTKKVTISEIEGLFGCRVEIVNGGVE